MSHLIMTCNSKRRLTRANPRPLRSLYGFADSRNLAAYVRSTYWRAYVQTALLIPFTIILMLFSDSSYSQPSGDAPPTQSNKCDASCIAGKVGLVAVPSSAALGYKKIMDEFGLAETEVCTGLPDQPMTENEISQTISRIKVNKAFERENVIVLDKSELMTKFLNEAEFESKLRRYSETGKGIARIAVRNRRLIKGGALGAALSAVFLFIEIDDEPSVSQNSLQDDLKKTMPPFMPKPNMLLLKRPPLKSHPWRCVAATNDVGC